MVGMVDLCVGGGNNNIMIIVWLAAGLHGMRSAQMASLLLWLSRRQFVY
jgi:hypothetical protein